MSRFKKVKLTIILTSSLFCLALSPPIKGTAKAKEQDIVQAQIVLTVSESKRLIAKAVAQMPIVKEALKNGVVIITKGTTCTYVAEEILGKKIPHGAYVLGRTYPEKGGKRLADAQRIGEVILVRGKHRDDLSLAEAVRMLKPGDVVIKGANALDYENKLAAGIVGSSSGGTTGEILPYVGARKAHLVIPVGLEKQVAGSVLDIVRKMQEPLESLNRVYSMFLFTGHIVTEIEALNTLADVSVFQAAAGGIGGAEGAVRLVCRGPREKVRKALKLAEQIHGEPPFVE
ncbi:MAG: sugar phosphate isomerase family [Planctomycetota bacterium]|jgi:hypothetical protein